VTGDVRLIRSPISVAGMVLTTISAVVFLVVFLADLFGLHTNPYLGLVFFVVVPALFIAGLLLIPLGAWIERRRRAAGKPPSAMHWPRVDLNDPRQRRITVLVFALTLANIVIVSLASYGGVEYMDSVAFCTQVCHPMKPQLRAHRQGPHVNARCVDCHVAPGAAGFAAAKASGTRQLVSIAFGTYPRPITAEPDKLVSAVETCERCHFSGSYHGEVLRSVVEFGDDETNTRTVTNLQMHVGGGEGRLAAVRGIHWHANPGTRVEYIATDNARQTIPYVKVTAADGAVREYKAEGATPELIAAGTRRRMECMDCHNRAGHPAPATAARAVNEALERNAIPATLPFVHREAAKALTASYPSEDAALGEIARALKAFYQTQQPPIATTRAQDVERTIATVQQLYRRSVIPEMNVKFGTYPDNVGHIDFPGCFRCHDDEHKTSDGRAIGQDCETCHKIE